MCRIPNLPIQPIILSRQQEPGMFDFYRPFPWFLKADRYDCQQQLVPSLGEQIIAPAEGAVYKGRCSHPANLGRGQPI